MRAGITASGHLPANTQPNKKVSVMILFGIILIIIGAVANIPIVYSIGVVIAVIGVILWILGAVGREVGGRRHYW